MTKIIQNKFNLTQMDMSRLKWILLIGIFYEIKLILSVDIVKVDALARKKISKRHFLKDIEISFHQVTHIGLESHQFFSF